MKHRVRLWTTSIAAAALVALPMIATAQTYPPSGQSGQSYPSSQMSSSDQNSPQFHLDEAKRVLDAISTSELSGAGLTQVSQIKTQFNDLYNAYKNKSGAATSGQVGTSGTTPPPSSSMATDWKTQFNKIEGELDGLNIPKSSYAPSSVSGTTGTGTSGAMSSSANITLPSEVRDSLEQFRTHLEQFHSLTQPKR